MTDDDLIFRSYPSPDMSPYEFEQFVAELIRKTESEVKSFDVKVHERIEGLDGSYDFDATVRYRFLGMDFLVLVEAKYHHHPIKRDVVQVLESKMKSVGAQKGLIVSSARYQSGALEFAKSHGIALVQVTEGRFTFEQRSAGPRGIPLSRAQALEFGMPVFVGHCYTKGSESDTTRVTLVTHDTVSAAHLLLGTEILSQCG